MKKDSAENCQKLLNPANVNFFDWRKEKSVQPLSIPEILAELQIVDDDYYRAISI